MKRIKQFDFVNYIPEYAYPCVNAVHFAEGKKITTDGKYLIAIATEYPPQMEGVSLCKDFTINQETYPNWKKVIPDVSTAYQSYDLNVEDLRIAYKLKGYSVRIKDSEKTLGCITPYILDVMIEFMNKFRTSKVFIPDEPFKAWKVETSSKDTFMVFMPRVRYDTFVSYEYNINRKSLTIFS